MCVCVCMCICTCESMCPWSREGIRCPEAELQVDGGCSVWVFCKNSTGPKPLTLDRTSSRNICRSIVRCGTLFNRTIQLDPGHLQSLTYSWGHSIDYLDLATINAPPPKKRRSLGAGKAEKRFAKQSWGIAFGSYHPCRKLDILQTPAYSSSKGLGTSSGFHACTRAHPCAYTDRYIHVCTPTVHT